MRSARVFGRRPRRDERGVILVMAVPGFILAVISLSLSVDIGRQVFEKRSDQSVADMASLDAARDLPNAQAAAEASALRNGFDPAKAGNSVLAERGTVDAARVFTLDPAGDAVRVSISSIIDYIFVPGSRGVTAKAVSRSPLAPLDPAPQVPTAGFTLGSTLASADTLAAIDAKFPLLDAVLGKWLKGTAATGGNADVVGWKGLLDAKVTVGALRDQLELLDAGIQFGTVDQLLDADITIAQLAEATGGALSASSDPDAALYAGPTGIVAQSTNTTTFKLGTLITTGPSSGPTLLATSLNPFQLLTGSAMVANGTNLVSVPDIGITIPGLGTTSLSLKVIEGRKTYVGPAGKGVSTSQVELTLTPVLNRPITVDGLTDARLTGSFPFALTAAGATGTLSSITCAAPGVGIRVAVDLKPFAGSTSANLGVSGTVLGVSVPLFTVATGGGLALTDPTPANLDFAYPGDFTEPAFGKRVGAVPLNLGSSATFTATATPLGLTPVPATLEPAVAGDLKQVVKALSEEVMTALHLTLGVSIGVADVAALKDDFDAGCATPPPPPPPPPPPTPTLVG